MRRFLRAAALAGLAMGWLAVPVSAEELAITGSGNPEYVLGVLAEHFNRAQSLHHVTVPSSTGTAGAIRDVLAGSTTLARVGRPLKPGELAEGLAYLPIGRDAVVFVGGAGVTVRAVTGAQMLDVFTGRTTRWEALGGDAGPIRAVGREAGDASRGAMSGYLEGFKDIVFGPGIKVVHLDPQMIELLDRYPTSLGMLNRSALFAARSALVPLALDGIAPDRGSLASGRYPVALDFGLIHRAGETPRGAAGAFIDFLRSPEGLRVLREHEVVPVGE